MADTSSTNKRCTACHKVTASRSRSAAARRRIHERRTAACCASAGCSSKRSSGRDRSTFATASFQPSESARRHAARVL
jgi:hypothetical protein